MRLPARQHQIYTRAERLSDAAVHVTGIVFAVVAVPVLVTLAIVWLGDRSTVLAALIYGTTLIAMLCCSAIYNMVALPGWRDFLRRIDQTAIYLKIAGTFTPFLVLSGTQAGYVLAGLWSAALAGAAMILLGSGRMRWPSLALYLGMGWIGSLVASPLLATLSSPTYTLIVAGGCIYTLGLVFFLWESLPFHNTIWHVFVLCASILLYCALVNELWVRAAV